MQFKRIFYLTKKKMLKIDSCDLNRVRKSIPTTILSHVKVKAIEIILYANHQMKINLIVIRLTLQDYELLEG